MAINGGLHNGGEEGETGRRGWLCGSFWLGTEWARPEGADVEEEARSRARLSARNGGDAVTAPGCLQGGEGTPLVGPAQYGEGRKFPSRWRLDGPRLGRLAWRSARVLLFFVNISILYNIYKKI
jgi:hypothetical protein